MDQPQLVKEQQELYQVFQQSLQQVEEKEANGCLVIILTLKVRMVVQVAVVEEQIPLVRR